MDASRVPVIDLDSIIITAELQRRPSRPPEHEAENRALIALAEEMASSPREILQRLAEAALDLCRAQSAGISLLEGDKKRFHWPALAGQWARHLGGGTPRDYGPCGTVLDRDAPLLFSHPERFFPYLVPVTPGIEEALLVPFYLNGEAVGTIWVIVHDKSRQFDTEDLRLLSSLGKFASAAYQVLSSLDALKATGDVLRASEGRLQESEEWQRIALEAGRLGSWRLDLVTGDMTSTALCKAHFGLQADDPLPYARLIELIHPEDRERMQAAVRRATDERREYETECRAVWPDGSVRWIVMRGRAFYTETGQPSHAVGVTLDVSERKERETALARSEERHRAVVTATSSVIWTTDADGAVVEPQPSWEKYTGQPWSEHQGFGWAAMVHPDDREAIRLEWRAACNEGRLYESRGRIWHAGSGGYRHFAARAAPVRDAGGRVREWVGTVTDVEERWQAEEALRQMDRLETVGQLAGGIAHEANNQMSVVLGFSDFLLRRGDLPEMARRDIQQVRKAAERTAAITSQLLAFSRRQILQPSALDLNELIKGMEPVMRRALGEAGTLVLDLAPALVLTRADTGQFEQVLLNFVLNARDAMPQGGCLIIGTRMVDLAGAPPSARPRVRMEPGRYAELTVRDTGQGMDEETLSRIFEPFFTTKPIGQGSGLGLSTVYGIVKQSGGYIWAASEPGRGTTFTIHLPLLSSAVPTDAAGPGEVPAPAAGVGQRVLLVEDDSSVREIAARVLTDRGYLVLEAEHGQAALDLLARRNDRVDAVVTDVAMPGLSARELAARIGQIRPGVPVFFMSGYTDDEVIRRGLLDAGQPFFQKPFTPEGLARWVGDLLRDRAAAPGAG